MHGSYFSSTSNVYLVSPAAFFVNEQPNPTSIIDKGIPITVKANNAPVIIKTIPEK